MARQLKIENFCWRCPLIVLLNTGRVIPVWLFIAASLKCISDRHTYKALWWGFASTETKLKNSQKKSKFYSQSLAPWAEHQSVVPYTSTLVGSVRRINVIKCILHLKIKQLLQTSWQQKWSPTVFPSLYFTCQLLNYLILFIAWHLDPNQYQLYLQFLIVETIFGAKCVSSPFSAIW
jgi:hypothetical protein